MPVKLGKPSKRTTEMSTESLGVVIDGGTTLGRPIIREGNGGFRLEIDPGY